MLNNNINMRDMLQDRIIHTNSDYIKLCKFMYWNLYIIVRLDIVQCINFSLNNNLTNNLYNKQLMCIWNTNHYNLYNNFHYLNTFFGGIMIDRLNYIPLMDKKVYKLNYCLFNPLIWMNLLDISASIPKWIN